jgi:hypothetical protein
MDILEAIRDWLISAPTFDMNPIKLALQMICWIRGEDCENTE